MTLGNHIPSLSPGCNLLGWLEDHMTVDLQGPSVVSVALQVGSWLLGRPHPRQPPQTESPFISSPELVEGEELSDSIQVLRCTSRGSPSAALEPQLRGLKLILELAAGITHCTNRQTSLSEATVNIIYKRRSIKTFPADSGLWGPALCSPAGCRSVYRERCVAFRTNTLRILFSSIN